MSPADCNICMDSCTQPWKPAGSECACTDAVFHKACLQAWVDAQMVEGKSQEDEGGRCPTCCRPMHIISSSDLLRDTNQTVLATCYIGLRLLCSTGASFLVAVLSRTLLRPRLARLATLVLSPLTFKLVATGLPPLLGRVEILKTSCWKLSSCILNWRHGLKVEKKYLDPLRLLPPERRPAFVKAVARARLKARLNNPESAYVVKAPLTQQTFEQVFARAENEQLIHCVANNAARSEQGKKAMDNLVDNLFLGVIQQGQLAVSAEGAAALIIKEVMVTFLKHVAPTYRIDQELSKDDLITAYQYAAKLQPRLVQAAFANPYPSQAHLAAVNELAGWMITPLLESGRAVPRQTTDEADPNAPV